MSIDLATIKKRLEELKAKEESGESYIKSYNRHGKFHRYLTIGEAKEIEKKLFREMQEEWEREQEKEYEREE